MSFVKYSSIENSYLTAFVNKVKEFAPKDELWIVQEKIHGANFSIIYDAKTGEVRFAKRTGLLEEKENFNNYQSITESLKKKILNLVEFLKEDDPFESITIYGELIGGSYPGMKGKVSLVQKGIDYCNYREFVAFDLKLNGVFLSVTTAMTWLILAGFQVVPEIGIFNTLDEALAMNIAFSSKLPERLGMPPHPGKNLCEGIVIKPRNTFWLPNRERAILKKKNLEFSEVQKMPKPPKSEGQTKFPDVEDYVTEARFNNVRSKMNDDINIGEIGKVMIEDVRKDYFKDNNIDEEMSKEFCKQVSSLVFSFVKKQLMK